MKDEVMADFKAIIRGLETEKYELQKQLEHATAEIRDLKAASEKCKDELWEAITKWHTLEKELEKQFMSRDANSDDKLASREEITRLKEEIAEINKKRRLEMQEVKDAKEMQQAAEDEADKFKRDNEILKNEREDLKE